MYVADASSASSSRASSGRIIQPTRRPGEIVFENDDM